MKKVFLTVITFLLTIISTFAQAPTNGLVAYYPFNGDAQDASKNNYNGYSIGSNPLSPTLDRFNNDASMHFDYNSRLALNGLNDLSSKIQDEFTISLWVKSDDFHNTITSSLSSSSDELRFFSSNIFQIGYKKAVNYGGFFFKYKYNIPYNSTDIRISVQPLIQNKWYFLTISKKANGLCSVYLDDEKPWTFIANPMVIDYDSQTMLNDNIYTRYRGNENPSWQNIGLFSGVIDDVYVFNRALSDDEVNILRGYYFSKSAVYFLETQNSIPKSTPLKVNFKAISN